MHLFLTSSCSNDYFHAYAIIYFLANRLVFQNMVTYKNFVPCKFLLLIHLRLTEVLHNLTAGQQPFLGKIAAQAKLALDIPSVRAKVNQAR